MSVMSVPSPATTHFKSPRATEAEAFGAWRQVMQLPVAREYQAAFQSATGLRLRFLDAVGMADMERVSGPFCGLAGPNNTRPVSCPRKVRLLQRASFDDGTVICVCCIAAVTEVVVPVLMGQCHVGSVVVGPFCLRAPTAGDHHTLAARWRERNPGGNPAALRKHDQALHALPVANAKRYRAAMVLARTFAQYLAECGNRMLLESATRRSPLLQRIDRELGGIQGETLTLRELGQRVGMSPFHLCRVFKREAGMTLTQYRLRRRIEAAKALLLNRHRRICEAAFEAGFESLPHFNRVFRRQVGCTPTQYRRQFGGAIPAAKTATSV